MKEIKAGTERSKIWTFGGKVRRGPTGYPVTILGHEIYVPELGEYYVVAS